MTLRAARILSSETDNTIKQEQNVDVKISVQQQPQKQDSQQQPVQTHIPQQTSYANISAQPSGFTLQAPPADSLYPSVAPTSNLSQVDTAGLENEIAELTVKNKFLELLLAAYQTNPLKINSYIIVNHKLLIEMIKLLTGADRVDLILADDVAVNCSCCADPDHDEIIYVSKILITMNGKTEELKYSRNDVSSQFVKFGISLKMTCQ